MSRAGFVDSQAGHCQCTTFWAVQGSHGDNAAQQDFDAVPAASDCPTQVMGSVGMADGLLFQ